jgi:hypothetical protein
MPKIHEKASAYVPPKPQGGYEWLPITDKHLLDTGRAAFKIIEQKIKKHVPCSKAFKALPDKRSFDDVWKDPNIWVSYYPSVKKGDYGATLDNKDITISKYALLMGRWTTAATLVHELAHCNGASGADTKAEDTLNSCLLKSLHDPSIVGELIQQNKERPSFLS